MLAFVTLLGTALAAFCGGPVWLVGAGTVILAAISISEHRKLATRFAHLGGDGVLSMAACQSVAYAFIATGVAFALGAVSRWALLPF